MKRNNRDIEADILRIACVGTLKTCLVYGANLNFNIVKKYLARLITRGFLVHDGKFYTTTPKGVEYMNLIVECQVFQ